MSVSTQTLSWQEYLILTGKSCWLLSNNLNFLAIQPSLVSVNTMNGGNFSPLMVTPNSTVQRFEFPVVRSPMVLSPRFAKVVDPNMSKLNVCLINIDNVSCRKFECRNLIAGIDSEIPNLLLIQPCYLGDISQTPNGNVLMGEPSVDPFSSAFRDTFSFPGCLLNATLSILVVQALYLDTANGQK